MRFSETCLAGAFEVEAELLRDERGFFARTYCRKEFHEAGLAADFVQNSISFNQSKGTLRGMHFQKAPHQESKLISCTLGAIFDVIIDLRPRSPTYTRWFSTELSADNRKAIFVPAGFAHGFLTLTDNSQVQYQTSQFYQPGSASGVRWNDPAFAIDWPEEVTVISERDANYPDFQGAYP